MFSKFNKINKIRVNKPVFIAYCYYNIVLVNQSFLEQVSGYYSRCLAGVGTFPHPFVKENQQDPEIIRFETLSPSFCISSSDFGAAIWSQLSIPLK